LVDTFDSFAVVIITNYHREQDTFSLTILLAVTQRREDAEGETVEMQQNPSETQELIFTVVLRKIGAPRLLN